MDLNTATRGELMAIPDIGPVRSADIIDQRPYGRIEDFPERLPWVTEPRMEKMRRYVTVGGREPEEEILKEGAGGGD